MTALGLRVRRESCNRSGRTYGTAFECLAQIAGFAALVVGILAVGIAANTALFSVVNAVLLRPLPYRDSHRIVTIWEKGTRWDEEFRAGAFFPFLRGNNEVFDAVARWCPRFFYVAGIENPHEVRGCEVTTNLVVHARSPALAGAWIPATRREAREPARGDSEPHLLERTVWAGPRMCSAQTSPSPKARRGTIRTRS